MNSLIFRACGILVGLMLHVQLHAQFSIGSATVSYTDATRSRVIDADVYYPATSAGANTPVASGSFPVLVFGHGFLMGTGVYDVVWEELVPAGYIMVLPQTEGSPLPSHEDFGKDIAFLADRMQLEGQNSGSSFYQHVAPASAAMGHSMGGGAAFLSAQYSANIQAIATLAAAETNPSAIAAAASVSIPALVIAGENDCVTPPVDHQELMYNALSSACKTYTSINGASHCQFASFSLTCSTGELTCSPSASISSSQQQSTTASLLLPWLDFYLKGSCAAGDDFQTLIQTGTGITSQQNCALSCLSTATVTKNSLTIYPNPAQHTIRIDGVDQITRGYIISATGSVVKAFSNHDVPVNDLPKGLYLIQVFDHTQAPATTPLVIGE